MSEEVAPEPMGYAPGMVLGNRYRLLDQLGGGGMGAVYRATDARTGGIVAVKVLRPDLMRDSRAVVRLRREVQIAASVVSPRVVRVSDFDEHEGAPYIVMEYAPGETLRDLLRRRTRLSLAETLTVGLEIARALEAGHAHGVVHRDLKPTNVIIFDGHVKVLDFGIARAESDLTTADAYAGTPAYSAPEQRAGQTDIRSDVYALGVMLFELLEGYMPPTAGALPSTSVPEEVRTLIARCMAANSVERYQTPTKLVADLAAALATLAGGAAALSVTAGLPAYSLASHPRSSAPTAVRLAADPTTMASAATPADSTRPDSAAASAPGARPSAELRAAPSNLPSLLTSFVGRVWEMTEIRRALDITRLMTLTGSAGSGKTRLALEVARGAIEAFRDGVWLVELAALTDSALLPQAVANAVGVRETPGRPVAESIVEALRSRRLLLLLDNCEHLLTPCVELADHILRACPQVKILATSREALGTAGETVWRVTPLSLPDLTASLRAEQITRYDAVRLFAERARAADPQFALTPTNAGMVVDLCHRLDGIPLALELAAARLRDLSVAEVAAGLDERFDLLTSGNRTALARQQTLRAALDWSHDLLTEPERLVLRRMSVFAGGCNVAAAIAVCGNGPGPDAVPDVLERLAGRSLITAEAVDERPHYHLLESMRQYGAERLARAGEVAAVRGLHAAVYLRFAEEREPALTGPAQGQALLAIEAEHDNLRAALGWATDSGDAETTLRMAGALWQFWAMRGHLAEGRRWLEQAARAEGAAPLRFKVLNGAGNLAYGQGDYARAAQLHEESLMVGRAMEDRAAEAMALTNLGFVAAARGDPNGAAAHYDAALALARALDDQRQIAVLLNSLGLMAARGGDLIRATSLLTESLALRRTLGDRQAIALLLNNLGMVAGRLRDHDRAAALFEESLTLRRKLGERQGLAATLTNLGVVAQERGEHARAEALHAESLDLSRELGDRRGTATALTNLGLAAAAQSAHPRAIAYYREALVIRRDMADLPGIASCLEGLIGAAQARGEHARVARLSGAADAMRERSGAPLLPAEHALLDEVLAAARTALGDGAYRSAWAGGRGLDADAAAAEALDGDEGSEATISRR